MAQQGLGIGGHQSAKMAKDEWLTPPHVLEALSPFDLDPCAPVVRPWPTAARHFTVERDGLCQRWDGRVWLNPPYGREIGSWLGRLAEHGNGVALIFARTETAFFFDHVWSKASAILFLQGRLYFHHVDGTRARANSGAPSCLVAYGEENVLDLERSGLAGKLIRLRS